MLLWVEHDFCFMSVTHIRECLKIACFKDIIPLEFHNLSVVHEIKIAAGSPTPDVFCRLSW